MNTIVSSNCDECVHLEICKVKEEFRKIVEVERKQLEASYIKIHISCDHWRPQSVNTRDIKESMFDMMSEVNKRRYSPDNKVSYK